MPEIIQFMGKTDGVYLTDEPGDWTPRGETCVGGLTTWIVTGVAEVTGPCGASASHRSWAYIRGHKVILHLCQDHADAIDTQPPSTTEEGP